jgi:hypothetical protein
MIGLDASFCYWNLDFICRRVCAGPETWRIATLILQGWNRERQEVPNGTGIEAITAIEPCFIQTTFYDTHTIHATDRLVDGSDVLRSNYRIDNHTFY